MIFKKRRICAATLFMLVGMVGILSFAEESSTGGRLVPFAKLMSHADQFDGELVRVYGFLRYRHHGMALFPSKDEAEYGFITHALWVYASSETAVVSNRRRDANLFDLDGRHVLLTGVVNVSRHGFKGAYPASLTEIREVVELERSK